MSAYEGDSEPRFTRVLGRGDVLAVAFGAMIGFGWVVKTGDYLSEAGTFGAALGFAIGGFIVALVGLTYAELVSALPHAGGEHNYVLRGFGSRLAFVTSWSLVLGYVSVVAFEAVALPQTLVYLAPDLPVGRLWSVAGYDVYASWAAIGMVAAAGMTYLNYRGVRPAAVFQTVAVLFLLVVGLAMAAGTFVGGSIDNAEPLFVAGASGVIVVLVTTPFMFVGFDVIPQSAEEIKLPHKLIGKLVIVSVVLATAWYVMIMITSGFGITRAELADSALPTADSMAGLWNSDAMGTVLVLGGIAGILTSWNGFIVGASRLLYAMAQSGMLPAWFGSLHQRYRTPSNAIVFIGLLSVLAPLFGEQLLTWVLDAGSISIILAYFTVALTFLMLRRKEPELRRPFRLRYGIPVGAAAAVLSLGLAVLFLPGMPAALAWPYEWVIVGLWWIAGIALLLRVPRVAGGPRAEDELLSAARKRAR